MPKRERGDLIPCDRFSLGFIRPNAKTRVQQTVFNTGHLEAQVLMPLLEVKAQANQAAASLIRTVSSE